MINKLTKEQELQIPKTIEKWRSMASKPMDHVKAIEYTGKLYKLMWLEQPLIIFGFSPMNTVLLCELFFRLVKEDKDLFRKLYSQLGSQLRSQLGSQLGSQLRSQLRSQLDSQLDDQLDGQLYSQLYSQLDGQLYSQLYSQLRSQLGSQLYSQLDGQTNNDIIKSINSNWYLAIFWLSWCGWYEYGKSIGVEFDNDKYDLFVNFNSEVNFIIPYKNICFISEKPTDIHWKDNNLHKDGDMAVKYSDGYGMHFLNGVKVPEYLAMTPEGELNIDFFTKETNADIKAEFIRKYGIDRMKHLGKSIDNHKNHNQNWWSKSEYELIDMAPIFTNIEFAPHLWMKNQTTGVYHLEAVHPECRNIEQALKFRSRNRNITKYTTKEIR